MERYIGGSATNVEYEMSFSPSILVFVYPTTPPAGPLNIKFTPQNFRALEKPPSLCIKRSLLPSNSNRSTKAFTMLCRKRVMIGLDYVSVVAELARKAYLIISCSCEEIMIFSNPIERAIFSISSSSLKKVQK